MKPNIIQNIAGVDVYYPSTKNEAWQMIDKLTECRNCISFSCILDIYRCANPEGEESFELENEKSSCECFYGREKSVEYWIHKLVNIAMEIDGTNDFFRKLAYHEKNGTSDIFLALNKKQ